MTAQESTPKKPNYKLIIMILLLITGALLLIFSPLGSYLKDITLMQSLVEKAGIWAYLIFIVAFTALAVMNIPGTAFMAMAVLIFGAWQGIILTYIAAIAAAVATFYSGRFFGAGSLSSIKNVRVRSFIGLAEKNPFRAIALLRTLMQLSPLVGYALALTNIKPRDYILANMVGLLIPIGYLGLAFYFLREQTMAYLLK